ncbi:hypothetical protein CBR_g30750 [Chara braunii]|uniref:Bax inhibitor 1 n=1 Tax=Chara braunii TaxID=69332 RepID=A0A388LDU6_CHABU|nr:hypothetical protein CBR_g30750 [Chara braunii]|eukprot:GBG80382.1 hypothetical protein CBR_g30750 [Chara braunii]
MATFSGTRLESINYAALFQFNHLSPKIQGHLRRVYQTLALVVLFAAAGAYAHILYGLGGLSTHLGFIGCTIALALTPREEEGKRWSILMGCGFLQGCSLGELVEYVLHVDPSIVGVAFAGALAVFVCFSASAAMASRRSFLYLGGVLSSALSMMFTMTLAGWLFGASRFVFNLEVYVGLLIFCGFILFDTQLIIEKAAGGDTDYITHALDLFVDFVAIFVRLLIVLLQKNEDKERRERRRKDRR